MAGETFWRSRLAWRWRGALQWPLFVLLTVAEGVLLTQLPIAGDDGTPFVSGALLAGFLNLIAVAAIAPLLAILLRRRRPELPKLIAQDHTGSALLVAVAAALVAAGIVHAPVIDEARHDMAAQAHAAVRFVRAQAPAEYRARIDEATTIKLEDEQYRTCVPGPDPDRWFCVIVSTDTSPPGITVDQSRESNLSLRPLGG